MSHVKQGLLSTELSSTPVFGGFHIAQSSVFFAMFYRSLFFRIAIVLSVLRSAASDYLFGILKHFAF
jgi:hypothetical protein